MERRRMLTDRHRTATFKFASLWKKEAQIDGGERKKAGNTLAENPHGRAYQTLATTVNRQPSSPNMGNRHHRRGSTQSSYLQSIKACQLRQNSIITEYEANRRASEGTEMQEALQAYLKSRKQPEDAEQFNSVKKELRLRQFRRKEQILGQIRGDSFLFPKSHLHMAALYELRKARQHNLDEAECNLYSIIERDQGLKRFGLYQ